MCIFCKYPDIVQNVNKVAITQHVTFALRLAPMRPFRSARASSILSEKRYSQTQRG